MYALRPGWAFVKKSLGLRACAGGAWAGTVRSVTYWQGLLPVPASGGYAGRAITNPVSGPSSFHPRAEADLRAGGSGESKRLVVESPWLQVTSECQRFGHPPRLNKLPF
jgi:hypothetical protein